ncbi:glycoside hydrolase family 88 protein [Sphingobacterium griseoflavum]|uniref:Glucuronyl hydrolase n=1 Tax=Sphingobacterium griseoflavum TaxID=1474952 RepID=A0ABQ3HVI4_9SPHI|nr:glycoside hydrolase family 88 protein [Sphingobacterium griseoflavum]GHE37844.1 glucuronyl hydrolase [Sphingobacterium griseoflavum]
MRIISLITFFFIATTDVVFSQVVAPLRLQQKFISAQLQHASSQILTLAAHTPASQFPRTFEAGQHHFSNSDWWCSGFYPGTLLYLYEGTHKQELLRLALEKLEPLEKEKFNKGTHDLGFMLYCSFGNALRLTHDSARYRDILTTGAESLASRFSSVTNTIRSWDHKPWRYPVIIDNMMNLEFLMKMSKITNDHRFADIAVTHANTTLMNHFREDYSSYHVTDYDPQTGHVLAKKTHQGAFDESSWARGQSWALYGYTMMFRETGDKQYLEQAEHVAQFILTHPAMPSDLIPYWDFDKDKVDPSARTFARRDLRDASAGALNASALLELSQYVSEEEAIKYLRAAELIIESLSKEPYLAPLGSNGGFILQHSVGSLPANSEVDVPLTYADYYYVEALIRYQRLLEGLPVTS